MATQPHHTPPFKLGHSERQLMLSSEGLPSAGRATNVFAKEDGTLMATGEYVPTPILNAIENKGYNQVSAEIYDNPPAEIKEALKKAGSKGKVLRAVAILGEELPRVKSLKDLPGLYKETGAFKEPIEIFRAGVKNDEGYEYTKEDMEDIARNFHILKAAGIDPSKFSERSQFVTFYYEPPTQGATQMNAEAIRKMLIEKGLAPELVNGMDDNTLLQFVDVCKGIASENSDDNDADEMKKKEAETKASEEEEKKEEKKETYSEKAVKAMLATELAKFASKFSEMSSTHKTAAQEAQQVAEKAIKQIKLSSFSEVVTKATAAGAPPALNADGRLTFIAEALAGISTVRKFGETEKTPFDVFSEIIATLPSHMPKPGQKGEVTGKDAAKKFSEHQEQELENLQGTYSKYSETFLGQGTTFEDLSKAFKLKLKEKPTLTAAEFLEID